MRHTVIYRTDSGKVAIEYHQSHQEFHSARFILFPTLSAALRTVFRPVNVHVPSNKRTLWEPEYRTAWETR